jgi:hypothetical protein
VLLSHDRHLLQIARPNVLLIGPETDMDGAISLVAGCPVSALPEWPTCVNGAASDSAPHTIVVRNVTSLEKQEQHSLHEWLERAAVRVISTSTAPMYPLVERQEFLEPLYYRLNIVCVESMQLDLART